MSTNVQIITASSSWEDVKLASHKIKPFIVKTPIISSTELNKELGTEVFFKCENFQKTGSFKLRGTLNALYSLSQDALKYGVAAHSSGNHGLALAFAAQQLNIPCYIIVPKNTPLLKREKLDRSTANLILCEPSLPSREEALKKVCTETGALEIHSSNNPSVISGAGTTGLELLETVPNLDVLIAPVGGGGLVSGCALAALMFPGDVEVLGAEPEGANDAYQSLKAGEIIKSEANTIADGLRSALGNYTFSLIQNYVHDILLACDRDILEAMRCIQNVFGFVVEPSAAISLAVVCANKPYFQGKRTGVILSGGNVDSALIPMFGNQLLHL